MAADRDDPDEMRLRERLEDQAARETPEEWCAKALDRVRDLATGHNEHFPADPLAALRNIAIVARAHVARAEAMRNPPAPRLGDLPEVLVRVGARMARHDQD